MKEALFLEPIFLLSSFCSSHINRLCKKKKSYTYNCNGAGAVDRTGNGWLSKRKERGPKDGDKGPFFFFAKVRKGAIICAQKEQWGIPDG